MCRPGDKDAAAARALLSLTPLLSGLKGLRRRSERENNRVPVHGDERTAQISGGRQIACRRADTTPPGPLSLSVCASCACGGGGRAPSAASRAVISTLADTLGS